MDTYRKCLVSLTHKRLNEAHRLWHQTLNSCIDPESFRTNLNATIQAIRNVTFALQNEKEKIPNFVSWYKNWQEYMKNDSIFSWINQARVAIVHAKDIELYSKAFVTIFNYNNVAQIKTEFPPLLGNRFLLDYLVKENVICIGMVDSDLCVSIERKWIISNFPDNDILDILAVSIATLYKLVREAHDLCHNNMDECTIFDTIHKMEYDYNDKTLLCMKTDTYTERKYIKLSDLTEYSVEDKHIVAQEKDIARSKKYIKMAGKVIKQYNLSKTSRSDDPLDFAEQFILPQAMAILQKDKFHNPMFFLFKPNHKCEMIQYTINSGSEKYINMRELSIKVRQEKVDCIIAVNECWVGKMDELIKTGLRASEQKDKKEGLQIAVIKSSLEAIVFTIPFRRNLLGQIMLESPSKEVVKDLSTLIAFTPIINEWKRVRDNTN